MSIFMEKITLTQAEYDATKNTLPADTLVYISDNADKPLAIGDLEINTGGGGGSDQTFVTTTDESATLPNSTNLGGLLTTGQKGVVINSVTSGTSTLTSSVLPASSVLTTNGSSDITGTTLTATKFLTTNASSALSLVSIPASSLLQTDGSSNITGTTLLANKFLTTNGSSALTQVSIPASSVLTTNSSNAITFTPLSTSKLLSVDSGGALISSNTITTANSNLTFNVGTGTTLYNAANFNMVLSSGFYFRTPDESCYIQLLSGSSLAFQSSGGMTLVDPSSIQLNCSAGTIQVPVLTSGTGTAVQWSSGSLVKATSSERFKHDIEDMSIDSSKIYELKPKTFIYNDSNTASWGYIAEDVNEVLPELVNYETLEDGSKVPFSLAYDHLSIILLEEIKKLNERIRALEEK